MFTVRILYIFSLNIASYFLTPVCMSDICERCSIFDYDVSLESYGKLFILYVNYMFSIWVYCMLPVITNGVSITYS